MTPAPRARATLQSPGERRSTRLLIGILALVGILWLVTWPIRSRMIQRTKAIEHQTAAQQAEIRRREALRNALRTERAKVDAAPSSLEARLSLAGTEIQAGQYVDAAKNLHAATIVRPNDPRPYVMLGALYDRLEMPDLAVFQYRMALRRSATDLAALLALAYKYVTFGWNHDAIQLIQRGLRSHPGDPSLHAALALVSFQTGDLTSAQSELLLAHKLAPADVTLLKPLIEVYRRWGRYQAALRILDQLPPADASSPVFLLERAQIYLQLLRPRQAIRSADQLLTTQPLNPDALYARATAERDLGETTAEQRDLEAVRRAAPATGQTDLLLGELLIHQGKVAQGRALMRAYSRRMAGSERMLRLALKVAYNLRDPAAHLQMAEALLASGDAPRAVVEYRRTLELQADDIPARRGLIQALKMVHRTDEAASLAKSGAYHPAISLAD